MTESKSMKKRKAIQRAAEPERMSEEEFSRLGYYTGSRNEDYENLYDETERSRKRELELEEKIRRHEFNRQNLMNQLKELQETYELKLSNELQKELAALKEKNKQLGLKIKRQIKYAEETARMGDEQDQEIKKLKEENEFLKSRIKNEVEGRNDAPF